MNKLAKYEAIGLVAAFALGGCAAAQDDATELPTIASSTYSRSFEFYQDIEAGMLEASDGLADMKFEDPNGDLAAQNAQVENFISQGASIITLIPIDSDAATAMGRMVTDAGIPLITVDIAITEDVGQVAHIASDNVQGGQIAAEKMGELLSGSGEVAVINNPAITSVVEREVGFVDALADQFPDVKVVLSVSGDSKRERAQAVAEDLLQKYPNLTGIFAVNDEMALGALQAVIAAGREDSVSIIGFDASTEGIAEIAKGNSAFKATVAQNPVEMGRIVTQTALKVLAGEKVAKHIPVPVVLVDSANYQDYQG